MIVRTLQEIKNTPRHVTSGQWDSARLLLSSDNMGFSFHITTIKEGATLHMQYRNHLESVYCLSGKGRIRDYDTGDVHDITPGTIYALDNHDEHELQAIEELKLACVFNPPVTGIEVHDEHGSYPLLSETIVD